MSRRFVSIWFRYLKTDWFSIRRPVLQSTAFVLTCPEHGKMMISVVNPMARSQGIETGMSLADARAIAPSLQFFDDPLQLAPQLLQQLAIECIRYAPFAAVDLPEGIILDATGCAHLWGGEKEYLADINMRLSRKGYNVRIAIADTIGCAWAMSRFGREQAVVGPGEQTEALLPLEPSALRLQPVLLERLRKLGLTQVKNFIGMPRSVLKRRFGMALLLKLDQALGKEKEIIEPVQPLIPYQERLPCLEPIVTATGIEIALKRLLTALCHRLQKEQKGIRKAHFKGWRVDGKIEMIEIGTSRASSNELHLFKLFEWKLSGMEPALGIELFILEAFKVEELLSSQKKILEGSCGLQGRELSELIDRLSNRIGNHAIHRYLPDEHYWPERSIRLAVPVLEEKNSEWQSDKLRPMQLLSKPQPIEVAAPIPDYPPMLFRYKGKLHTIKKADGPERIEREWWLEEGPHRDYYCVEDEEGRRYWLFRSGHYSTDKNFQWFLHGFFA